MTPSSWAWIVCSLSLSLAGGCGETRPPFRFVLPEGFRGFAFLEEKNPGCAPLPMIAGYLEVRMDPDGKACTSADLPLGYSKRDEFRVGSETLTLWPPQEESRVRGFWSGTYDTASGAHASYLCFFVGSEEEFEKIDVEPCRPPAFEEEMRRLEAEALGEEDT